MSSGGSPWCSGSTTPGWPAASSKTGDPEKTAKRSGRAATHHVMTTLQLLSSLACVAAIAHRADASCEVTLDGDPAAVASIQIELSGFPPAAATDCVVVVASVRAEDGGVEIELRDELGRTAVRMFASSAGAAA